MSYDITVGAMSRNMTSNVSKMWDRAMPGLNLRDMNGRTGAECLPHLEAGMLDMARNRDRYERMVPDNGWGSYGGALSVLVEMAAECRANPNTIVSVHC
jgi:hypothetical protein